jgi:phenylacetate-coenzyme A ligase PaaK-like adenylate-forming protein
MKPNITPLDGWIAAKIGYPDQPLSHACLQAYQLGKLRETLAWARSRSRFYQQHLTNAPHGLDHLADLAQFPFTTAQDVRERSLQFLCVSQDEIQRVVTLDTSGTTGTPKRLYFTREDQELTLDFFRAGMSTFTSPGDRVLILLPVERPGSVGDLLATALTRLGAQPIKHGPVHEVATALDVLQQERVDVLVGIPTQVLALAYHSQGLQLKSVLLTTDHVPQSLAGAVERAWGCRVYDHYGMTEMGLGGGVECQARAGYHVREADLYVEVIDPASGQPVAEGETGEVVFSTLTRRGMPLIRYRTGDLSRFIPGACPCGTCLPRLERITQRIGSAVAIGDQWQVTLADLDEALFSVAGVVDFRASISREAGRDSLRVEAMVMEECAVGAITAALESIPALRTARQAGKLSVVVDVRDAPSTLPRPAKRTIGQSLI